MKAGALWKYSNMFPQLGIVSIIRLTILHKNPLKLPIYDKIQKTEMLVPLSNAQMQLSAQWGKSVSLITRCFKWYIEQLNTSGIQISSSVKALVSSNTLCWT